MGPTRFDAIARTAGARQDWWTRLRDATRNWTDPLGLPPVSGGGILPPGAACTTDEDCSFQVCDGAPGWHTAGTGACKTPPPIRVFEDSAQSCRAMGAPCDSGDVPPTDGACCEDPSLACSTTSGDGFPGGLPAFTCHGPTCPSGATRCLNREYSAMGPYMCIHPNAVAVGATCSGTAAGALSSVCDWWGERDQDQWSNLASAQHKLDTGEHYCLCCTLANHSYGFTNLAGVEGCPTAGQKECWDNDDCPAGQACMILPAGACDNPTLTSRDCRPLCGEGITVDPYAVGGGGDVEVTYSSHEGSDTTPFAP